MSRGASGRASSSCTPQLTTSATKTVWLPSGATWPASAPLCSIAECRAASLSKLVVQERKRELGGHSYGCWHCSLGPLCTLRTLSPLWTLRARWALKEDSRK